MMAIRRAEERGTANFGWLSCRHTFSFGHYYDPRFMGFGPLRVINEDHVQPGCGFGTHGHQDMEIISYVLEGEMAHRDSLGSGSLIRPGDVQRMSAGTGVRHSEYNASDSAPLHFLQIWIMPERNGLEPSYEQKTFTDSDKAGWLRLVGSRDGRDGSVTIHQDVDLYAAKLAATDSVTYQLPADRKGWVQVASGDVQLGDEALSVGDGVAIEGPHSITLTTRTATEVLLFD
ncbi:MAG TPA: pirin family protein, partial [Halomonas sp.]|nr:pirin family protein [Halomonas sp.]